MLTNEAKIPELGRVKNGAFHPLSFQQERVFYLNEISPQASLWNRVSCKRLSGHLDADIMKEAVEALIGRHPVLRTRISLTGGKLLQSLHESFEGAFEFLYMSEQPAGVVDIQAQAILNREYERPFSLDGGQLFKATLVRWREDEWQLILKLHHIISDATTLRILWNDLKQFYNTRLTGGGDEMRPLELDYLDYATWLRERFTETATREQEGYWLAQFADKPPELDLPADFPVPPGLSFKGAMERHPLPPSLVKRLHSFSLKHRVIPFSTMLAAYFLLLHNYCRQDDIVIGTVFSGRHYSPKIKALAGFFTNTVALRARLDPDRTVEDFVRTIHGHVDDAWKMQDFPLERLVDRLDLDREHRRNPLFRAMFNMVTGYEETQAFQGIQRERPLEPDISATQVDFFLDFHMNPDGAELRVEYNTEIFAQATIRRMLRHYVVLLEAMMADATAFALDVRMLDAAEEQLVRSLGAGEAEPAAFSRSIVELLEDRAAWTPDQMALVGSHQGLTCGQLNRKVNQLAARLMEAGVVGGDIVAIMLERSPEMVIAVLAVLKAGAAYLPIDPAFPSRRIDYILRNSGVRCLLVQGVAADALPPEAAGLPLAVISVDDPNSYTGSGANPGRKTDPSAPAYVLYTSGSTGNPKGVVVEHRALMNTLEFLAAKYPLTGKTILFKTNFTFDVSASELFGWIFDGGRIAVLDKGAEGDRRALLEAILSYGVTHINFVPSMLDAFLSSPQARDMEVLERLRYVMVAGEALKPDLVNRFHTLVRGVRLENLYGPTEAAIYATWYSLPRGSEVRRVPIGKPLANTSAYILDEKLRLLPVGIVGELCLSGIGLAREYMNQPELTAEKFCANPHREGERLYRTGDLARWGDDGLIYYLGRADGQVKIRGFRIELAEIERKLLACRGVTNGVVAVKTDRFGQKGLVAYVVMEAGQRLPEDRIRAELAGWLPNFMIPEFFVPLDQMPRLPSGKINLHALPEPERAGTGATVAAVPVAAAPVAATGLEQTIITIAENLLNTTGLTPSSNFFRLGGNSLLTLRFIVAIDEALGTRLTAVDFLRLPTIAEIAKLIEPMLKAPAARAEAAGASAPVPA